MNVGVIGLGTMGMGAAVNLVNKGHRGHRLRPPPWPCGRRWSPPAARRPSAPMNSPRDLDAVLVLVVNAAQEQEVLFGAAGLRGAAAPRGGGDLLRPPWRRKRRAAWRRG